MTTQLRWWSVHDILLIELGERWQARPPLVHFLKPIP
nr:MAG TPA: hypothetical protein [Caudoviricetes sp.]